MDSVIFSYPNKLCSVRKDELLQLKTVLVCRTERNIISPHVFVRRTLAERTIKETQIRNLVESEITS